MSSGPAAIPIFGDAYLADTTHLSTEEHGAYFLLMLAAWRQVDCSLPNDPRKLANIARVSLKRWNSIGPSVMEFWTEEDGRFTQKRLTREHKWVSARADKNRFAAETRWERQNTENKRSDECKRICGRICQNACVSDAPPPPPPPKKKEGAKAPNAPASGHGRKRATRTHEEFLLPDDIPSEEWVGFEEMRKRKRAPMTDRARGGVVKKLRELRTQGHDPGDVLDQSTRNSWTDVYPIKEQRNGSSPDTRGSRPDPAVDLWNAAEKSRREREAREIGGGPRLSLPSGE